MLLMNDGSLTVSSASSRGTRPRDPARSRRLFLLKDYSVAGLVVPAAASPPQIADATGQCLWRSPFGISSVRESLVQPPVDRSRQAG